MRNPTLFTGVLAGLIACALQF